MQSESSANGPKGRTIWALVAWREAGESVTSLRQRIFKAARANDLRKARSLQKVHLFCHQQETRRQFREGKDSPPADDLQDSCRE